VISASVFPSRSSSCFFGADGDYGDLARLVDFDAGNTRLCANVLKRRLNDL
jgi:hypothetical protein